ncbi:MAG TPA: D-alanyl-D-alanine carboxypeptidase/D-alanyl-D-alanine-endopeptidase [Rhodanobacteraceae bacterium]|nr:D-alanyl-D-alanine carboxypeptidase/D-alanyl-D-alanine-endopeptidase [Rhodanobacteraceae bacterium]
MFFRTIRAAAVAGLLLILPACASAPRHAAVVNATAAHPPAAAPTAAPPVAPPLRPPQARTALAERIDAFISQPRFAHATWGIAIVDPASGQTRYAHNADKLVVPASNVKLYTTTLALATLGGDARFTTTLYATSKPRSNGLLRGDLILYGRGDPSLGDARVAPDSLDWAERFAGALAEHGVTRISGDLIADDTWYQGSGIGGGWEADDLPQWYAPRVSALTVQDNLLAVLVSPDGAHGAKVRLEPTAAARVVNLTHDAEPGEPLRVYQRPGSSTIIVSGQAPSGTRRFVLAAPDPALMAAQQLKQALDAAGIALAGSVRVLHWPQKDPAIKRGQLQVMAQVMSPPLSELVRHTLKDSDNLYAQHLLLQVGVHTADQGTCSDRTWLPRTTQAWGLCAMRAFLRHAGIGTDQATFVEGSGLSRKDLATPAATTALLVWIEHQPFADVILDALPVAGVDGTLVHRLRDTLAEDNLRAKTGTLTHVYALSGFVDDADGRPLVFSLTLNHYQRPRDEFGRIIQPSPDSDLDTIAGMLAEWHRPVPTQVAAAARGSGSSAGVGAAGAAVN